MRAAFGFLVVLLVAAPASATSYIALSLAEAVYRSDLIVVADVTKASESERSFSVRECLLGTTEDDFVYRTFMRPPFADDDIPRTGSGIYFFERKSGGLRHLFTAPRKGVHDIDEVRAVVRLRLSPAWYMSQADANPSLEFAEMLGLLFQNREAVDGLGRNDALRYLDQTLQSTRAEIVCAGITSLIRLGGPNPNAIIPLLEHENPAVRWTALKFLNLHPDLRAVVPLRNMLSRVDPAKSDSRLLASTLAEVLARIGDQSALPELREAFGKGFTGVASALGRLGSREDFELILGALNEDDDRAEWQGTHGLSLGSLSDGLRILVLRSNKQTERWMQESHWSAETGLREKPLWLEWWKRHGLDFEIVVPASMPSPAG